MERQQPKQRADFVWLLECPSCLKWGELDDDQFHGRVSVDHEADVGCGYHETHDFAEAVVQSKTS